MSAHRDSPDDIHSAVENGNTVSAYFTSKQILPFGFAELYCCRCSRHRASSMQVSQPIELDNIHASHLDGPERCRPGRGRNPKFKVVLYRGVDVFQVI